MAVLQSQLLSHLKVKIVRQISIFILYLVFVYWATQAVLKFLDEPTTTRIYYKFGENGKQLKPSTTTFCGATKPASHVEIFKKECGLNSTEISGKDLKALSSLVQLLYEYQYIMEMQS